MRQLDRRAMLRYSGMTAASLALRGEAFALAADAVPVAATTAGKVSGGVENGINVFRGIPYGADTVTTRFQPPRPVAKWSGVKECVSFSYRAPQLTADRPRPAAAAAAPMRIAPEVGAQSEDCLHLNVWTPALRDRGKRPVLVYFHGGAYNNGSVNSALYDGNRLCHRAQGDAVVVTVNHRLNAFGFLYLGDIGGAQYAQSGNVGMLDLVLALQWVRDNIAEFGGDASRVLIFGQSGGGAKCATLMAMPVAKGLFHRVMTMSGQQVKGASIEIASRRTKMVLEKLGIPAANLEALKTVPMEKIQEAARSTSDWLPVVDNVVLSRDPFTPDAPPLSEDVPMILGNTRDETAVIPPATLTWEQAPGALKSAVAQYIGAVPAEEIIAKWRAIYPAYTPQDVVVAAQVAFRAWAGQVLEAERRAANPKSQRHTWVYQMNYKEPFPGGRAIHTIDIPFMFDNLSATPGQVGSSAEDLAAAQPLADAMSAMLVNYAKTGNPNHAGLVQWPAYDLTRRATLFWDKKIEVADDPRGEERRFAAASSPYRQPGTY